GLGACLFGGGGGAARGRGGGVGGPGGEGAPGAGRDAAGLPLPAPRPPLEGVAGRAVRGTPRARAVRRGSAQGGPPGPDGDGAQGGGGRPGGADGGVPGGGAGPQAGPLAPAVQYQPAGARRGAGAVRAAAAARAGLPGGRTRRVPGRRAVRLRQAEPRPRAAPLAAGAVADDRLAGGPGVQRGGGLGGLPGGGLGGRPRADAAADLLESAGDAVPDTRGPDRA